MFNKFKHNKDKYLVLIEPGGLGDYIFCRPFFKYIKKSEKYKNHKLIYVASEQYVDFVKEFDKEYFDKIITYNADYLKNNKYYQKFLYSEINKYNVDTLVNLRTNVIDQLPDVSIRRKLAKNIKAKYKYVDIIKSNSNKYFENKIKFYNCPIYDDLSLCFELERRQRFFEKFLEQKLPEESLNLYINKELPFNNYLAISMSAVNSLRELSDNTWLNIINNLQENFPNKKLVFIGASKDKGYIENILNKLTDKTNCINYAGKTSITTLPKFLSKADALIAVDTGTVHIANLVNCKTICFSNGLSYGRFHPYKNSQIHYVYPPSFEKYLKTVTKDDLIKIYSGACKFSTTEILGTNVSTFLKGEYNVSSFI